MTPGRKSPIGGKPASKSFALRWRGMYTSGVGGELSEGHLDACGR